MSTLAHLAIALKLWLGFVVFTVFPVAFPEIGHWLYEWQVLVTGILVLVAAYILGRSIVKAARLNATAQTDADRQPRPMGPAVPAEPPGRQTEAASEPPTPTGGVTPIDRLVALRQQIRMTLGTLPCTDAPLSAGNRALCGQIAQFSLSEDLREGSPGLHEGSGALYAALGGLRDLMDADATNRGAWAALVRLSTAARNLIEAKETPDEDKVDWNSFADLRRRRETS